MNANYCMQWVALCLLVVLLGQTTLVMAGIEKDTTSVLITGIFTVAAYLVTFHSL